MADKRTVKKFVYIILGCIGVGLGAVGVVMPMLPAFPFFMMFRQNLYVPCGILIGVWLFHIIYFSFGVKKC